MRERIGENGGRVGCLLSHFATLGQSLKGRPAHTGLDKHGERPSSPRLASPHLPRASRTTWGQQRPQSGSGVHFAVRSRVYGRLCGPVCGARELDGARECVFNAAFVVHLSSVRFGAFQTVHKLSLVPEVVLDVSFLGLGRLVLSCVVPRTRPSCD